MLSTGKPFLKILKVQTYLTHSCIYHTFMIIAYFYRIFKHMLEKTILHL